MTACVAFLTPVFVALYVLTIPKGTWLPALIAHLVASFLVALAASLLLRTRIWIEPDGLKERGFLGRTHRIALSEIGSVIVADTYTGVNAESKTQLFICDHAGKQTLRMRGQFWSANDMRDVADAVGLPVTRIEGALSKSELLQRHPGLLYWFERHPALNALALTAATAGFAALSLLVLNLSGASVFR